MLTRLRGIASDIEAQPKAPTAAFPIEDYTDILNESIRQVLAKKKGIPVQ